MCLGYFFARSFMNIASTSNLTSPELQKTDSFVDTESRRNFKNIGPQSSTASDVLQKKSVKEIVDCLKEKECEKVDSYTFKDKELSTDMSKVEKELIDIVQSKNIKEASAKYETSFFHDTLLIKSNRAMLASAIILFERESNLEGLMTTAKSLSGRNAQLFMSLASRYPEVNEQFRAKKNELLMHYSRKDNNTLLSLIDSIESYSVDKSEFQNMFKGACPHESSDEIDKIIRIKINKASKKVIGAALCQ